tara:strand:- start:144 stop:305 length:162 start_codon:yes stop_codon:yes gene_type:complete
MIREERDYMSEMFKEIRDGNARRKALLANQSELHPTWAKKEKPLPIPKSMYHN